MPRGDRSPPCRIEGCERKSRKIGLCEMHHKRFKQRKVPGDLSVKRKSHGVQRQIAKQVKDKVRALSRAADLGGFVFYPKGSDHILRQSNRIKRLYGGKGLLISSSAKVVRLK